MSPFLFGCKFMLENLLIYSKVFNNKLKTLTGYMPFKVLFIINGFALKIIEH